LGGVASIIAMVSAAVKLRAQKKTAMAKQPARSASPFPGNYEHPIGESE
jgi:hypothetical protein